MFLENLERTSIMKEHLLGDVNSSNESRNWFLVLD